MLVRPKNPGICSFTYGMRSLAPSHDPLAFHLAAWNLQQHKQAKDNTVHTVRKSYTELALGLVVPKAPFCKRAHFSVF